MAICQSLPDHNQRIYLSRGHKPLRGIKLIFNHRNYMKGQQLTAMLRPDCQIFENQRALMFEFNFTITRALFLWSFQVLRPTSKGSGQCQTLVSTFCKALLWWVIQGWRRVLRGPKKAFIRKLIGVGECWIEVAYRMSSTQWWSKIVWV